MSTRSLPTTTFRLPNLRSTGVRFAISGAASLPDDTDVEIIVVDDCSTDGSGQEAGRLIQDMRREGRAIGILRTPGRSGTERAKNFGLRLATAPIAVVLDAHAFPAQGALERLVAPMLEDPDLVVAGPTVVTLPTPKAAEKISGVWPLFNPIDLEIGRLACLTPNPPKEGVGSVS